MSSSSLASSIASRGRDKDDEKRSLEGNGGDEELCSSKLVSISSSNLLPDGVLEIGVEGWTTVDFAKRGAD